MSYLGKGMSLSNFARYIIRDWLGGTSPESVPKMEDVRRIESVYVDGGSNVTLTDSQSTARTLLLYGTLAADIALIVPDALRTYNIINDTTGGYSITVRTDTGSGVTINAGTGGAVWLRCDGTDVVRMAGTAPDEVPTNADRLALSNINLVVGPAGDYATVNAAFEYLSRFAPLYQNSGITATVTLKSGFTLAEQLLVSGINFGWVTIEAQDAITYVDHTALTIGFNGRKPVFGVNRAGALPQIGALFEFSTPQGGTNTDGVHTYGAGSSATVLAGCGVMKVGSNGIYASYGSTINANGADASGAGNKGIYASYGSTINANGATGSLSQTANTLTSDGTIFQ